jgi:tetratricopeptide (TPR) repeat protein
VLADYTQAIRLDPNDAAAYNNRGIAYKDRNDRGDIDLAIADYTQAIRIDATLVPAYNNRGNAYYTKKEYQQAVIDYTQALKLEPNNAEAKKGLEEARKQQR